MVDFGGFDMPLHYGSQLDEHHAVRRAAGMFDVSHMRVVDVAGALCVAGAGVGAGSLSGSRGALLHAASVAATNCFTPLPSSANSGPR